jgi:WD40 repeat protein
VVSVAISPDGAWLATASRDRTVRIWDVRNTQPVSMMRAEASVYCCAWFRDGRFLAVGGTRGLYLFRWQPGLE